MGSKRGQLFNIKNRSAGGLSYTIPEDNIHRIFAPGETKRNIPYEELEKLSFQPGGKTLMANYLQIDDVEVVSEFNLDAEREYWYSEEEIVDIMANGSMDAFLDMLDFAPVGVIDLVKTFAVEMKLNDYRKREAILEKTGFDVSRAIENIKEEEKQNAEDGVVKEEPKSAPTRRVKEEEGNSEVTKSQYTIIKDEN